MPKKDPRIDAYIAKSADFAKPILTHIRKLVHVACPDVEETIKWRFPHFTRKGILCGVAGFKEHCALVFWKGKLIFEKEGLVRENEKGMGHFGRITSLADLPKDKVLIGYIKKAVALNEAGIEKPSKPKPDVKKDLVIPRYFTMALQKNKKAKETFEGFSYTCKKEYVEWITEAKTDETRGRRLTTTLEWMAEGKTRNWKYLKC